MKIRKNILRKGFTLVELLVVIAIIAALAALSTPAVTKALKRAALTTSVNNVRQIKLVMDTIALDFDGDYPNTRVGNVITSGAVTSPETALNTFHVGGYLSLVETAELAYTKEVENVLGTAVHTRMPATATSLAATHSGYSYVGGLTNTSNGLTPILMTKMVSAVNFDSIIWDHKAVIVRVNGSTKAERLVGAAGTSNTVNITGGTDSIFATSELPATATVFQ